MKIDILAVSGSPVGQTLDTIWGKDGHVGVGGSELFLLTMCELWAKAGHEVRLYNDPRTAPSHKLFQQCKITDFLPGEDRDILIGFRVLDWRFHLADAGKKVFLSCDQYATGDFKQFYEWADQTVCISEFHKDYFAKTYGIFDAVSIDIPVRLDDYSYQPVEKVPYRCLFSSVPDRGLDLLALVWPKVVQKFPAASLVITSDYRLWNTDNPQNDRFRRMFLSQENVQFLGAVNRERLIQEQLRAELMPYPCIYDELFCIAVAEAQVAGCYPITSDAGALRTTNTGTVIPGNPREYAWMDEFFRKICWFFEEGRGSLDVRTNQMVSSYRFSPTVILREWDEKVFHG